MSGFLESGKAEGATALAGGGRHGDRGYFIEPTVLTGTRPEMKVVREEIFGPVLVAAPFTDLDEIAAWARVAPADFLATAASELNGSSLSAGYGPPYNTGTGSVQHLLITPAGPLTAPRRHDRGPADQRRPGFSHKVVTSYQRGIIMSVYRVTEIIGTSSTSWEDAAAEAISTAAGTIRDLRVAEVVKQDIHLDEDGAITYRTKLQLSFKYEHEQ